jgi:hypothetical protein
MQGTLGPLHQNAQQRDEVANRALDALGIEKIRGVHEGRRQVTGVVLLGVERQVAARKRALDLDELHVEARQPGERTQLASLVVEHHLKRRPRRAALRLQLLHQALEREILVGLRLEHTRLHLPQQ